MTTMLQGKRKREAIRAMQRGTFMAYITTPVKQRKPKTFSDRMRELMANAAIGMRRFGDVLDRTYRSIIHTMIGVTQDSMHAFRGAGDSPVFANPLYPVSGGVSKHHTLFPQPLDRYGLKPMPPYEPKE